MNILNWKNIKLGWKFGIGFGVVLLLLVVVEAWSIFGMNKIINNADHVLEGEHIRDNISQKIVDHFKWASKVSTIFTDKNITELDVQTDPHKCAFGKWYYSDDRKMTEELFPSTKPLLEEVETYHNRLHESAININKKLKQEGGQGIEEAKAIYTAQTLTSLKGIQELLDKVSKVIAGKATESEKVMRVEASKTYLGVIIVGLIAIVLGIAMAFLIAKGIIATLSHLNRMLKDIAEGEGDLTKRLEVNSKDEVGEVAKWFNTFIDKLHGIITSIASSTHQLASASEELSASSSQITSGTEKQKSQTEQMATSMEEMSATVMDIAKNANEAADSAKGAAEKANKGGDIVKNSVEGMNRIADAVKKSAGTIEALKNSSEQIGEIISVIDDIADQTNLLALNAAIEAARAGEQGRGFAVVADEVRKLAERTTKATKEIADMIKTIQSDTGGAVSSMEEGSKEVESGVALTNEAGEALKQIVAEVEKVTDMVQQIATSTEEQSAASEEISSNVEAVSTIAKETATGMEQSNNALHDLSRLATELKDIVGQFKLKEEKVEEG